VPAAPGAIAVRVEVAGPPPAEPVPVRVVAEPRGGAGAQGEGGGEREAITVELRAPGQGELALPPGTFWSLHAEAAGYWAAAEVAARAPGGSPPAPVTLRLHPAGRVSGRLQVGATARLPEELRLRFEAAPGQMGRAREGAEGEVDCALGEEERSAPRSTPHSTPHSTRRFSCVAPAGAVDLRLRAQTFVPVYRWGETVVAGETLDLGEIPLRPGASVVGWVESPEGEPLPGARVTLAVAPAGSLPDPAVRDRLGSLELSVRTDGRGFFQLSGVSPGVYVLSAEVPDFAPARLFPLEVREGLEARLKEPLVLAPPAELTLVLDPPADAYGRPWRLELFDLDRAAGLPGGAREGAVSPEGLWRRGGLAPGRYGVGVIDADGDRWAAAEIRLESGPREERLKIPLLALRGTLTLGGEPAAGLIWFGGRSGQRRVRFAADLEGHFEGYLPAESTAPGESGEGGAGAEAGAEAGTETGTETGTEAGTEAGAETWAVEVELAGEEETRLALEPVEVRPLPGKAWAEVELEIPDTTLTGEVVDEEGRAVPGARISALFVRAGKPAETETAAGDAGQFRLRGLPEGNAVLHAQAGERGSDYLPAVIDAELDPPHLRLVVRSVVTLAGQVISASGPVPGARVLAMPDLASAGGASVEQTLTGPDGTFTVRLPAPSATAPPPGVTLVVRAPGFATYLGRVELRRDEPARVLLETGSGTLILAPPPIPPPPGPRSAPILVHEGAWLPLPALLQLLGERPRPDPDGRLILPALAGGTYTVCVGPGVVRALRQGDEAPEGACVTGFLPAFGELVLTLP